MRTASVRDLRNNFANVAKWIEHGEEVTNTRNGTTFATLTPAKTSKRKKPDWATRLKNRPPLGRGISKEEAEALGQGCETEAGWLQTLIPDTSFLVSLACRDSRSAEAEAYIARSRKLLVFTPLHRMEARNALRHAAARKVISTSESRAGFRQIEDDLRDGLLVHLAVAWTEVFRRADELARNSRRRKGSERSICCMLRSPWNVVPKLSSPSTSGSGSSRKRPG